MEFEINSGKNILRDFILYSEINLINKLPNKLQIKIKHSKFKMQLYIMGEEQQYVEL